MSKLRKVLQTSGIQTDHTQFSCTQKVSRCVTAWDEFEGSFSRQSSELLDMKPDPRRVQNPTPQSHLPEVGAALPPVPPFKRNHLRSDPHGKFPLTDKPPVPNPRSISTTKDRERERRGKKKNPTEMSKSQAITRFTWRTGNGRPWIYFTTMRNK